MIPQAHSGSAERRALASVTAPSSTRARGREWKWATAGAGMLALAAIAFALRENQRNTELAAAGAAADARADSLAAELVVRDSLLVEASETDVLLSIVAAPDRHELSLFGRDTTRGRLIASQGRVVITAAGLPTVSADSTYALWLENDFGIRLLADLGNARENRLLTSLPSDSFLVGWAALLVTAEREPPDSLPRGEVLLEYRGWLR